MKNKIFQIIILVLIVFIFGLITLKPSHNRVWDEGIAILPYIETRGNEVLIKNLRDWRYNETDIIAQNRIDRRIDLNKLEAVWFVVEPFGAWDGVAHTMLVFDFKDSEPVVLSVEARREMEEQYDAWLGLLKKYELVYMWTTEQDSIARRVVNQKHDLYMYPLDINLEYGKLFFLELVKTTNAIYKNPRFYNTLTQNCTNVFAHHANRAKAGTSPWHISRILPGYSEEFLYKEKYIKSEGTFEEVKERFYITDIVSKIQDYENFSRILRGELLVNKSKQ